ncbi:MAG: response regulator [Gammaproteobacteria bacterium]
MTTAEKILVVEDEIKIAQLLDDYLTRSGYDVSCLHDGTAVVGSVRESTPDLLLLDLMLPGRDGLEICRELRTFTEIPIIMITARVEEIDRLLGLELGADDYICKPFSPREVVARVKAVLRRQTTAADTESEPLLQLDANSFRLRIADKSLDLTQVEYQLCAALFSQPGRIFSRDQLMDRIYSDGRVVSDRTIDSHIKKLRKKLRKLLPEQELIHSVYGAGYRYELIPDEPPQA